MTVLHRSSRLVLWDLVRAAAGGGACVAVAVLAAHPVLATVAALGVAVFVWFAGNTLLRGMSVIELGPDRLVERSPLRHKAIAWTDLSGFRLRYFATRRDGSKGWYSLQLTADSVRITVDSELDDFATVLELARAAAEANGLDFDPATAFNLQQFGGAGNQAPFRAAPTILGSGA